MREQSWYCGGVKRGITNIFAVEVENRNAGTLREIIQHHVLPGTKIITDESRAYRAALSGLNEYQHFSINHNYHSVDPIDPSIHTQNIECLWSPLKENLESM